MRDIHADSAHAASGRSGRATDLPDRVSRTDYRARVGDGIRIVDGGGVDERARDGPMPRRIDVVRRDKKGRVAVATEP